MQEEYPGYIKTLRFILWIPKPRAPTNIMKCKKVCSLIAMQSEEWRKIPSPQSACMRVTSTFRFLSYKYYSLLVAISSPQNSKQPSHTRYAWSPCRSPSCYQFLYALLCSSIVALLKVAGGNNHDLASANSRGWMPLNPVIVLRLRPVWSSPGTPTTSNSSALGLPLFDVPLSPMVFSCLNTAMLLNSSTLSKVNSELASSHPCLLCPLIIAIY